MVAEHVNDHIPDRLEVSHKEALRQRNPYRHDNKVTTGEVAHAKIASGLDALCMFPEPVPELTPCG
jgi:hypothetical protein